MQAIQTATITGSALLNQENKIGSLQPGRLADMVTVTADPTKNIEVLENIPFVMKGGVVYQGKIPAAPAE